MLTIRRLLGPILIAAVSITLAACAASGSDSTGPSTSAPRPTPTQISTQSPTPSPTPTPTPSPSFDSADPSTWVITGAGIGGVEIGSASAADALIPAFAQADWCEGLEFWKASGATTAGDFGVIIHPGANGVGGVGVRVPSDVPIAGPVEGSPVTNSGIGLGSTVDELIDAEPTGAFETASEFPDYVVGAGQHWILFEVSEAEPFVRGITVTETVPPAGYCG